MFNLTGQVSVVSRILWDVPNIYKSRCKQKSFYFEDTDSFLWGNIYHRFV